MEIGATPRVAVPQVTADVARVGTRPTQNAVQTDLPARKSVQQAESAVKTETRAAAPRDTVDRNVTIDLETQKAVYRAVDERTGDVLIQLPDPRYLKAYLEQKRAAEQEETTAPRSVAVSA